jgi:hypothetical protein
VADPVADPALRRLQRDLADGVVDGGVAAGMWRVVSLDWPVFLVAITLGDGNELGVRILVDHYPVQAPSGQPWDLESPAALPVPRWPLSTLAVPTFRPDWSPANGNAPYLACDRIGLRTHPGWAAECPDRAWNPGRRIGFYLTELHRSLQDARLPERQAKS